MLHLALSFLYSSFFQHSKKNRKKQDFPQISNNSLIFHTLLLAYKNYLLYDKIKCF